MHGDAAKIIVTVLSLHKLLFLAQPSDSGPEEESDTLEDVVPLNIEDEESMAGSQDCLLYTSPSPRDA